jgi:hypothetical protein
MATEIDHVACANRTQLTIRHLLDNPTVNSPWLLTTGFYKALHVVESVFFNERTIVHCADHSSRERVLKRTTKCEHIAEHYGKLERASRVARYLSNCSTFDDYLTPEEVVEIFLRHHLFQIEKSARKFLKDGGALLGVETAFFP